MEPPHCTHIFGKVLSLKCKTDQVISVWNSVNYFLLFTILLTIKILTNANTFDVLLYETIKYLETLRKKVVSSNFKLLDQFQSLHYLTLRCLICTTPNNLWTYLKVIQLFTTYFYYLEFLYLHVIKCLGVSKSIRVSGVKTFIFFISI